MIVKCAKCSQSYKIDDRKVPSAGVRIKCPKCGHTFIAKLGDAVVDSEPKQLSPISRQEVSKEPVSTWRIRLSGLTYAFQSLEALHDWLLSRSDVSNIKIAKDNDDWGELGDYPEVITAEMITRFFPLGDVPVSGKKMTDEELDEEMDDEDAQHPTREFPTVMASQLQSATKAPITKPIQAPRANQLSKQEKTKSSASKLLIALAVLLAVCILLQVTNIVNFMVLLPYDVQLQLRGENYVVQQQPHRQEITTQKNNEQNTQKNAHAVENKQPKAVMIDEAKAEADRQEKHKIEQNLKAETLKKTLALADQMIKERRYPEARAVLENLASQYPDEQEVK